MLKKEENAYGNKIQKLLNKLISEEWYVGQTYMLYVQAMTDLSEIDKVYETIESIASDEQNDHLKKLCTYAKLNGYTVPCNLKEFQKHAEPEIVKMFNNIKKNKSVSEIISESIVSETLAINSYDIAKNSDEVHSDQELLTIILEIFYDECEHIQQFQFLNYAMQAAESIIQ